jgi:hypothetical protein
MKKFIITIAMAVLSFYSSITLAHGSIITKTEGESRGGQDDQGGQASSNE